MKVETSGLLKLDDSKIYNGTVTDNGTVEITGFSAILQCPPEHWRRRSVDDRPDRHAVLSGATFRGTAGGTISNDGT